MKTLQLRNGDLVIGPNGHETVTGGSMVAQDLRCALGEPVGNDRFHPGYGSVLESFVGQILDPTALFMAEQEVNRVVANYAAIQSDRIQRDALSAARSRFTTADIISSVGQVSVTSNIDAVQVEIAIKTMSGQDVAIAVGTGT